MCAACARKLSVLRSPPVEYQSASSCCAGRPRPAAASAASRQMSFRTTQNTVHRSAGPPVLHVPDAAREALTAGSPQPRLTVLDSSHSLPAAVSVSPLLTLALPHICDSTTSARWPRASRARSPFPHRLRHRSTRGCCGSRPSPRRRSRSSTAATSGSCRRRAAPPSVSRPRAARRAFRSSRPTARRSRSRPTTTATTRSTRSRRPAAKRRA